MFAGIAVLLILAAFCVQLLFCFRVRKRMLRWIPVVLLLLGELVCAAVFVISVVMEQAGKGIYGAGFAAFIYGIILFAALLGTAFAWLLWGIVRFIQKRRK